jgi:hypothetical protein
MKYLNAFERLGLHRWLIIGFLIGCAELHAEEQSKATEGVPSDPDKISSNHEAAPSHGASGNEDHAKPPSVEETMHQSHGNTGSHDGSSSQTTKQDHPVSHDHVGTSNGGTQQEKHAQHDATDSPRREDVQDKSRVTHAQTGGTKLSGSPKSKQLHHQDKATQSNVGSFLSPKSEITRPENGKEPPRLAGGITPSGSRQAVPQNMMKASGVPKSTISPTYLRQVQGPAALSAGTKGKIGNTPSGASAIDGSLKKTKTRFSTP